MERLFQRKTAKKGTDGNEKMPQVVELSPGREAVPRQCIYADERLCEIPFEEDAAELFLEPVDWEMAEDFPVEVVETKGEAELS